MTLIRVGHEQADDALAGRHHLLWRRILVNLGWRGFVHYCNVIKYRAILLDILIKVKSIFYRIFTFAGICKEVVPGCANLYCEFSSQDPQPGCSSNGIQAGDRSRTA